MAQLSFLDGHGMIAPAVASARHSDPETSRAAATKHERTGRAASHRLIVEREVNTRPGQTYREIARAVGLDATEVMRRLNDLEVRQLVRKGTVRECTVSTLKNRMSTWWPA